MNRLAVLPFVPLGPICTCGAISSFIAWHEMFKMGKVPTLECFLFQLDCFHSQAFWPALNGFEIMNTSAQQHSRHVSVPSNQGVRVDKTITINRPVAEVYAFWRHLENLPRFMRHLESVTVQDNLHSHWSVKTVGGKVLEWDAEIIEQRPNEMISWRSAPGADIDNAGSVWFTSIPGGEGTIVRVELKYIPPAGKAGATIAKFLDADADAVIGEDLRRLKTLLETGHLPPEGGDSAWRRAAGVARKAASGANARVHENPWSAVTLVGLGVFALGFLLGSRLSSLQEDQHHDLRRRFQLPSRQVRRCVGRD